MRSAAPARTTQATYTPSAVTDVAMPVTGTRGVVYTRDWVVELMLDLAGYIPDQDLAAITIVDPSCGNGAFLRSVVHRLIVSCQRHSRPLAATADAIRAYDIDSGAIATARHTVIDILTAAGVTTSAAAGLADTWLVNGDYLLPGPRSDSADIVIANPPYVRLEHISRDISDAYRAKWPTMSGRADLYIGFLEAALSSLRPGGRACVICPDRWMRNQYGRKLRERLDDGFNLDLTLVMHDTPAFEQTVSAYPAVVLLRHGPTGPSLAVDARSDFAATHSEAIVRMHARGQAPTSTSPAFTANWLDAPPRGGASWPVGTSSARNVVAHLEEHFPTLGDHATGTRVGVGVATGADSVFITSDEHLVEPDRLLPLVFSQEITSGHYEPRHKFLVNPWTHDGQLVDLDDYPRLRDYYSAHEQALRDRHVAKRRPQAWFRTIDKIDSQLLHQPKILLPDLKPRVHPVVHPGGAYPQHNLFFVTAATWDLEVLAGLLLSDYATDMLETYSVKMANGCLRVTAQYLKRIRIPPYEDISQPVRRRLRNAYRRRDTELATNAAADAYGLA